MFLFLYEGVYVLDNLSSMDEAWFHLSGYMNSQNTRVWFAENLHLLH